MNKILPRAAFLGLSLATMSAAYSQSANEWYPTEDPGLIVTKVSYNTQQNWDSDGRIEVQFANGVAAFYYFSPSSATSLNEASVLYASLLTSELEQTPAFIYITQSDPNNSGTWDFAAVQLGNN